MARAKDAPAAGAGTAEPTVSVGGETASSAGAGTAEPTSPVGSEAASSAVAGEAATGEVRRGFRAEGHILHDGSDHAPGDIVFLTEAELDALRRAGAVAPDTGWLDGEDL